jgi:hypothetical protein
MIGRPHHAHKIKNPARAGEVPREVGRGLQLSGRRNESCQSLQPGTLVDV